MNEISLLRRKGYKEKIKRDDSKIGIKVDDSYWKKWSDLKMKDMC